MEFAVASCIPLYARRNSFIQFLGISACTTCGGLGKVATKYCENCKGKGKVKKNQKIEVTIPKGVNSGQYLRLEGKGEPGRNASAGDLFVVIHVAPNHLFKREEENLFLEKKIDLATAIFGGSIDIQGIDKKLKLKIPDGTESHTFFKLKKQGMPFLDSRKRGDLFIKIIVEIPKLGKDKEKTFKQFIG